jgi:hypothetical protein
MIFLKPSDTGKEFTFTAQQREQLRQALLRWIQSPAFDEYFFCLHQPPREALMRCLSAATTLGGLLGMCGLLRNLRQCGIATARLRRGYLELAKTGQVVWGQALNTAAEFRNGKVMWAKARVLAAAEGTPEADKQSIETMFKFCNTLRSPSNSTGTAEVQAMAADVSFKLFRVRPVPEILAGNVPVYLFDVILDRSANSSGFQKQWSLVCMANPAMRPSLLGIPAKFAFRSMKGPPGVELRVNRSLKVP